MKTLMKLLLLTALATTMVWAGGNRHRPDHRNGHDRSYQVERYRAGSRYWPGHRGIAARYYARPMRPGPRYVWVEPYWDWRGPAYGYIVVPGRWVLPPRPHSVWVEGLWAPRGGTEIWISAHWR